MKKTTLFLLCCGALAAQADFVYQSGTSFTTTADLDGNGRSDLVLVDGSNASVRIGYQLSANTITWAAPRSLGLNEVTDIACGNILNAGHDVLVATAPMLNRYHLYHLDSPSQPPVPTAFHAQGVGSKSVAALDIGGSGNTANDDLFGLSVMNGTSPYRGTHIRSDGAALSSLTSYAVGSAWNHLNEVEYASGLQALGVIDGNGSLRLYDLSAGMISQIDYVLTGFSTSAAYLSFIPQSTPLAEFLVWEPGSSLLQTISIIEPTTGNYELDIPIASDLGSPIDSVQLVQGSGITRLAVVFDGGVAAALFDYDGTGAPTLLQEMDPPENEFIAGFLPIGADDLVMLSSASGDLSGAVTVDQQTFSGGQFVSTGTQTLPALGNTRGLANVMTFASEPFVDNAPRRLQLLRAGDWSSDSQVIVGVVSSTVETDSGITTGLGNPQTVSLGAANPSAAYTLDNQLHAAISTYSFDTARGDELVGITVNPDAGVYGTSIAVSFSTLPSAAVHYRTSSSDAWTLYENPFTLFKDTTVQYYAVGGTGQTIIREATYTFTESPSDLDSDGDGVPDYVELAHGLDPFESGLDSDGDGFSDLEELLAGSSPTNSGAFPASSNRVEHSSVYDLAVAPLAIASMGTDLGVSAPGTQVRLFSATGGLMGYAKTTNHTLSISVYNPAALFEAVPLSQELPFVTARTDTRFNLEASYGENNQRGVEMVGLYLQPTSTISNVSYAYQGGSLTTEAAAWIAEARSFYTNQLRVVQGDELQFSDVVDALLVERKLADLLVERNVLTNGWVSLFKGRSADQTMDGFRTADLQSLEQLGAEGQPAYSLRSLVSDIRQTATGMDSLAADIYGVCADYGTDTNAVGKYPLPVDVLREFIFTGNLQSNYVTILPYSEAQLEHTYTTTTQALAQVSSRPIGSFMLEVGESSFDAACPVLNTAGGTGKSLYSASGNPFKFPLTFRLQPGAQVSVTAFTDVTWNQCPGTDPLEVISLALTAVPTASGSDADGNLIPDDYESMFLVGSGGLATSDLDGDGFSDLQEYLEETDPDDIGDVPSVAVADFSPPIVEISTPLVGEAQLDIDWPAAYADAFVFTVLQSTNLADAAFAEEVELTRGALTEYMDTTGGDTAFYQVQMKLR